ncbi:MAG: type II and III secretion system protein, partial [Planctomycetota bacterium]
GYVVENGVITIATLEALPSPLVTLVYDVTDLLGRPADYYAQSPEEVTADVEMAGAEGFEIEEELDREQMAELAVLRAEALVTLIQETVEPDSWYVTGGEGTIIIHENKKLIVLQTRKVHNEIDKLLGELRKALGHQVAIEARFLLVGENFLEDIGLDLNIYRSPLGALETIWLEDPEWLEGIGKAIFPDNPGFALPTDPCFIAYAPYLADWAGWFPGYNPLTDGYPIPYTEGNPDFGPDPKWGDDPNAPIILLNPLREIFRTPVPDTGIPGQEFILDEDKFRFFQQHRQHTWPEDTEVPGSWGSLLRSAAGYGEFAGLEMGIGGMILDTLQVDLLLRATQAHRDATFLNAPRVSVLSGESATLRVQKIMWYPTDFEFDIEEIGELGDILWTLEFEDAAVITGSILNITPTITPDKKNILLNIVTELRDFLGWEQHAVLGPQTSLGRGAWTIVYPTTELSRVETRVSVPDGGTLLLGGHKLTAEVELESGVPVLSKIPIIGRAFSNRSKVKDQRILLILVQPKIILREEAEAGAVASMRENY